MRGIEIGMTIININIMMMMNNQFRNSMNKFDLISMNLHIHQLDINNHIINLIDFHNNHNMLRNPRLMMNHIVIMIVISHNILNEGRIIIHNLNIKLRKCHSQPKNPQFRVMMSIHLQLRRRIRRRSHIARYDNIVSSIVIRKQY